MGAKGKLDAYETLKNLTRGLTMSKSDYKKMIKNLNLDTNTEKNLLNLTPQDYTGIAKKNLIGLIKK